VSGEGDVAFWTAKAVERLGYRVGPGGIRIEVLSGQPTRWMVRRDGREQSASSMEEVAALISPAAEQPPDRRA
jgi:hypothetical protein